MKDAEKATTTTRAFHTPPGRVTQLSFYLAAVVVLCLGLWLAPGVVQSRRAHIFAILLVATMSLLLATLGSLTALAAALKKRDEKGS